MVRGLAEAWGGGEPGEMDIDGVLLKVSRARGFGFLLMLAGR